MTTFKLIPTNYGSISCAAPCEDFPPHSDINSPASSIMTDIVNIVPRMILPDTSIEDCLTILKHSNNQSKLYIGTGTKLLGVASRTTMLSRDVLMIANRKGLARTELTVADIMSQTTKMPALTQDNLNHASIGDIKHTMQRLGEAHIQVVDKHNKICGVISASDISKALDVPVIINLTAHSFKDCFEVIHAHSELI
jgi:CBS domain-containing protein